MSFPVALSHPDASPIRGSANSSTSNSSEERDADALVASQTAPASYSGSFNPFPALVIGVTGIAMAAHQQDYVYEVSIHSLWGVLLASFAVLRCLTYFFLWLRPPSSILPSRPPTEALASFSLAAGGLTFMLSSEEISFAFMRHGYDDMMAVLNVVVAVICLVFFFIAGLMTIKGAASRFEFKQNSRRATSTSSSERRDSRHFTATATLEPDYRQDPQPVFVLEDEEERDQERQLIQSPEAR